jgi:uncharacterized metal-binding protein
LRLREFQPTTGYLLRDARTTLGQHLRSDCLRKIRYVTVFGQRPMTKEQKQFFEQRTKQALEEKPHLKPLLKKLLSFGGKAVVLWNGSNGINSVAHLLAEGRVFSNRSLKVVDGEQSQCHDNVLALWRTKPDDYLVVTGYGLSKDSIWRPHSWCVDRTTGKIIETTERRTKYFGVEFSKSEFEDAQEAIRQHQKSVSQIPGKKAKGTKNRQRDPCK